MAPALLVFQVWLQHQRPGINQKEKMHKTRCIREIFHILENYLSWIWAENNQNECDSGFVVKV